MRKILILSLIIALSSGCMTRRQMAYVQDKGKKKDLGVEFLNEQKRALIQTFDELYINVTSFSEENPELLAPGDLRVGGRSTTDYSLISYQVDEEGNIDLPLLGKVHVAGKTVDQVAKEIQEELKSYFYAPSVKVSFVNKNVTVLGMVENPGRYFYSGENINIFQALGLAGDIEEYGDRKRVVIIRESNGRIRKNRVDLTDKNLFISDFYYLKSGDVVYVEPLNRRIWGINSVPFSLILSAATTSLLIIDYVQGD